MSRDPTYTSPHDAHCSSVFLGLSRGLFLLFGVSWIKRGAWIWWGSRLPVPDGGDSGQGDSSNRPQRRWQQEQLPRSWRWRFRRGPQGQQRRPRNRAGNNGSWEVSDRPAQPSPRSPTHPCTHCPTHPRLSYHPAPPRTFPRKNDHHTLKHSMRFIISAIRPAAIELLFCGHGQAFAG